MFLLIKTLNVDESISYIKGFSVSADTQPETPDSTEVNLQPYVYVIFDLIKPPQDEDPWA